MLVLLGSIVVIVSLSLEVFHGAAENAGFTSLWVCIVFLVDFFTVFLSRRKWGFSSAT